MGKDWKHNVGDAYWGFLQVLVERVCVCVGGCLCVCVCVCEKIDAWISESTIRYKTLSDSCCALPLKQFSQSATLDSLWLRTVSALYILWYFGCFPAPALIYARLAVSLFLACALRRPISARVHNA